MNTKEILNSLTDYNTLLQSKDKNVIKAIFANANSIEFPEVNFTDLHKEEHINLYIGLTGNTLIGVLHKGSQDALSDIIAGEEVYTATFTNDSCFTGPIYQPETETSIDSYHAISVVNRWTSSKNNWVEETYADDNIVRVFQIPVADIANNTNNKAIFGLIVLEDNSLEVDLVIANEVGLFDLVRPSPPYGGWPPIPEKKPKELKPKPKSFELAEN